MAKFRKELNTLLKQYIKITEPLVEEYRSYDGVSTGKAFERKNAVAEKLGYIKEDALEDVEGIYRDYVSRVDARMASFDATKINPSEMALLDSNFYQLTPYEFNLLQDKYEGNQAMERVLIEYAKKRQNMPLEKRTPEMELHCRFLDHKEKKQLARNATNSLEGFIKNSGEYGVSAYAKTMAGDMFQEADMLKE